MTFYRDSEFPVKSKNISSSELNYSFYLNNLPPTKGGFREDFPVQGGGWC
jgi:hypothetical protein